MSIRSVMAGAALAGWLVAGTALAEPEAAPGTGSSAEPGIWQDHQIELAYIGFTSHYSCDGLQSKLELLLRQLGARADAKVSAFGCDRGFGTPSRFPRATMKFATLQPANAESVAAAVTPAATPVATPVAGVWRSVQLAPHRPYTLDDGDCELMEQFRDKVLPLFATRDQQLKLTCVPHQDIGPFSLQMQVFALPPERASK